MKLKLSAKKAIMIGSMCSLSYLAVYVARNVLGAVSPQMIEQGAYSTEAIGMLSSLYFITYAVGQLINGAIGDKIKAKYMISFGLILAGVCNYLFSVVPAQSIFSSAVYALSGFALSMIYAPMTKVQFGIYLCFLLRLTCGRSSGSSFFVAGCILGQQRCLNFNGHHLFCCVYSF